MDRKTEASRRTPSFFKVMFGDFSERLKIPPAFVYKHFNGVVSENFRLKSPSGRTRTVNMKKIGNNLFFDKGWRIFLQDNSLELGDFVVFFYAGSLEFNVTIFGRSGCEKEVTVATKPTRKSNDVISIDSDCSSDDETEKSTQNDQFRSTEFYSVYENFKQERTSSRARRVTHKSSFSLIDSMVLQGKARALEAASKFVSNHPFFQAVIRQYCLRTETMQVPRSFVKTGYFKVGRQTITLLVSNKSWSVRVWLAKSGRIRLGCLHAFVKDNILREGDVCVFEMIKRNDIVLKVSIFRSVP